jgi:hypothetical protein
MHTRLRNREALLAAAATLSCFMGAGTLARPSASPTITYQNVQVSHNNGATAEPSIAVDPRDPSDLLATSMIINHHRVTVSASRSSDGGRRVRQRRPRIRDGRLPATHRLTPSAN